MKNGLITGKKSPSSTSKIIDNSNKASQENNTITNTITTINLTEPNIINPKIKIVKSNNSINLQIKQSNRSTPKIQTKSKVNANIVANIETKATYKPALILTSKYLSALLKKGEGNEKNRKVNANIGANIETKATYKPALILTSKYLSVRLKKGESNEKNRKVNNFRLQLNDELLKLINNERAVEIERDKMLLSSHPGEINSLEKRFGLERAQACIKIVKFNK